MIFNLLNRTNKEKDSCGNINLVKIIALLIHAAKIDENYSEREKKMITDFVMISSKIVKKSDKNMNRQEALNLIEKSEKYENDSNQILEYTQEVKKMDLNTRKLVLEFLWKIILSDDKADVYENTLIRRICGLMYIPDKLSGEIKLKILKSKKI